MNKKLVLPNDVMLGEVSRLLSDGKEVEIMTKGVSMLPFIRGEIDSVLLEKRDKVEEGDIVLAEILDGRYVLHRVRRVFEGGVVLKGDGNIRGTERCAFADVCGTVKKILRPGGERDPFSPVEMRRWRRWCSLPRIVRRGVLFLYRRYLKSKIK